MAAGSDAGPMVPVGRLPQELGLVSMGIAASTAIDGIFSLPLAV